MSKDTSPVVEVKFEIKTEHGHRAVAVFVRKEKIDDLMTDQGSLGEFLRDLRLTAGGTDAPDAPPCCACGCGGTAGCRREP